MYSRKSGLIIGFHGGDRSVCEDVVSRKIKNLRKSNNSWDWLGKGIYFWENNPQRALEFAKEQASRQGSSIKEPFVLGAVIDLGYCLDLMDSSNLKLLSKSYETLKEVMELAEKPLPINSSPKDCEHRNDLLIRRLDFAVIEHLHTITEKPFDSVKGIFIEGKPLYENAGFREKDHIQLCIRNPNCIKGYFLPRNKFKNYPRV